jgi:hypothetical protein
LSIPGNSNSERKNVNSFYTFIRVDRPIRKNEIMTAETYHFDKGTEMPLKFQDRWVAGATGFKDIQDALRHLQWREARRRLAEIAEKYDLDEYGLPRRGTW